MDRQEPKSSQRLLLEQSEGEKGNVLFRVGLLSKDKRKGPGTSGCGLTGKRG